MRISEEMVGVVNIGEWTISSSGQIIATSHGLPGHTPNGGGLVREISYFRDI